MNLAGSKVGPWVLLRKLGEGGTAQVWLAENEEETKTQAAVKVMKPNRFDIPRERFAREIAVLTELDHPTIVRTIGSGETEDGMLYLALEYVRGDTLVDRIERGPMTLAEVGPLFESVAEGVAHAHEKGLAHRDIKPGNLMISITGAARILDFGNALEDDESERLTREGMVTGTRPYLPPEALDTGKYDAKSADVYALGVCLYEALLARPAYRYSHDGTPVDEIEFRDRKSKPLDLPASFPQSLRDVILRASHPQPSSRTPDMRTFQLEFAAALAEATRLGNESTLPAEPPPQPPQPEQHPDSEPFPMLSFALFCLGGAAMGSVVVACGFWLRTVAL